MAGPWNSAGRSQKIQGRSRGEEREGGREEEEAMKGHRGREREREREMKDDG
jgi:hypothetical protein